MDVYQLIQREKEQKTGKLDIGNCGLTSLPPELFELTWLEKLIVSNDYYDYEKREWIESKNQGKENFLYKLPKEIAKLKNLKALFIGGEKFLNNWEISDINALQYLTKLEILHLSGNQISDISSLKDLTQLNSLYLSQNKISDISSLKDLTKLNRLDLRSNQISDISSLKELTQLNSLNLSDNQISDISSLKDLTKLKELFLLGNQISDISSLKDLTQLNSLDLSSNQISDISSLKDLTKLKELFLFRNQISDISSLKDLTQLNSLYLSDNQISDISSLKDLTQLNSLNLRNNQISDISSLKDLTQLNRLDLRSNQISDISSLKDLTQLQELDLSSNQISDIKPLLELLKKGLEISGDFIRRKGIGIANNPLTTPPMSVVQQGREVVIEYLNTLKESERKNIINREVKLVLLGNSTAGKSTLIEYLITKKINKDISSTHGMELKTWEIDNFFKKEKQELNVHIMDFGGQEFYHDTHNMFLTKNTAYLIVWEKENNAYARKKTEIKYKNSDQKVWVDLDMFPLEYWLHTVQYFAHNDNLADREEIIKDPAIHTKDRIEDDKHSKPSKPVRTQTAPVIIVQNKVQKTDNNGQKQGIAYLNNKELKENFPFIRDITAISLYEKYRTRELTGMIKEMFEQMTIVGSEYPADWQLLRETFVENPKKKYQFIYELAKEWKDFAGKNNFELNVNGIKALLAMLKEIGLVYYQPEHFDLKNLMDKDSKIIKVPDDLIEKQKEKANPGDIVVFDTSWLLGEIYKILNADLEQKEGVFDTNDMKEALGKQKIDNEYNLLLKLMKKHHLIVDYPEQEKNTVKKYIAPQYLPSRADKKVNLFLKIFKPSLVKIEYQGFFHKSLVLEFLSTYSQDVFRQKNPDETYDFYFWRDGIVLSFDKPGNHNEKELILVEFNNPGVQNEKPNFSIRTLDNNYSSKVREILEKIKELSKRYEYSVLFSHNQMDFIPQEKLEETARKGQPAFEYNDKLFQLGDFNMFLDEKYRSPMKKAFISYSKEDVAFMKAFEVHLANLKRQNLISVWHDRKLEPGDWDRQIHKELEEADIIFFLLSPDFFNTDYINDKEIKLAFERKEKGEAVIFPIIIRHCDYENSILGNTTIYPEKAEPISDVKNDKAWLEVVRKIKEEISK